ncbi:hypothetical protein QMK19_31900 [Streptomyces sp. H10-C2]|uniref:hypothetical protein n=1 Tax=unclassified Streptomyces TaxID=2593676 RepID=UPI0024B8BB54|nr:MULTISPECIES: hypothetical protein [unclassified Streptomyces]MDJ0345147.1 hypothetical protein [Streptomyces sp. PH10-H1]MDJ0374115.1 hypothetical protein [Streptomyces sp. H10-C2]
MFERGDERVLGELLGEADVVHHPREPGDDGGRLEFPDRIDGAMGVRHRHDDSSSGAEDLLDHALAVTDDLAEAAGQLDRHPRNPLRECREPALAVGAITAMLWISAVAARYRRSL